MSTDRPPGGPRTWRRALAAPGVDYLVLVVVTILACAPLLLSGLPKAADDSTVHIIAFEHFARQFFAGDLYPRWLVDMNAGYGSPMFFYYPPLPYYAASLTSLLTFWTADPWLEVGFSVTLATLLSGVACYAWLRQDTSRFAALAAAVLYLVLPYHLAVDIYLRGALGEVWAFAWMPLLMLAIRRSERPFGFFLVALAVALLLVTHLPTTLLVAPVAGAYTAWLSWRSRSPRMLLTCAGGALLGAVMAAAYLAPALLMQDAVDMSLLQGGHLSFRYWFLFAPPVMSSFKTQLTFLLTSMVLLVVVAELLAPRRRDSGARHRMFWFVTAIASFLLMTGVARPLWEPITLLHDLQFPWRLGTVLSLAAAAVAGHTIQAWREEAGVTSRRFLLVLLPVIALTWVVLTILAMLPREWPRFEQRRYDFSMSPAEYRPPVSHELFSYIDPRAPMITLTQPTGSIAIHRWSPRHIVLGVASDSASTLEVRQIHFPGWTAQLADTARAARALVRPGTGGKLAIDVPSGNYTVTLKLAATGPEKWGNRLSIAGWSIWAAGLLLALSRSRSRRRARAPQAHAAFTR